MRKSVYPLTVFLCLIVALILMCLFAKKSKPQVQYKRLSRDAVTRIATEQPESALVWANGYLKDHPEDIEAHFVRTLALTQIGDMNDALTAMQQALDLGLDFGRFLAGPRKLFEPLYQTTEFKKLALEKNIRLIHGPVVGSVTSESARFWVRTVDESEVAIRVKMDGDLKTGLGKTCAVDDYTGVVEVGGLQANTRYPYEVWVDGRLVTDMKNPEFRTFPEQGESCRFTLGFGGGAGYTPWKERMWTTILDQNPDAFLLLGDNVYIDTPEVPETQRYCYYRRQSRPEYREFAASTPIFSIWDDHDFGDDDCVSTSRLDDPPWKLDVLKVFTENFVNPYYGSSPQNPGCFFDFSVGDVDFFMLDCRFYREDPHQVEEASMLGSFQKNWLFGKLKASKATFKMICSSVPWATGVKPGSKDPWDGFPEEREEIFSFLEQNQIEGVVLLAADRHRSDAWKIEREHGYALYDLMSSRLTNIHKHKILDGALFGYNETCSFGKLTFDTRKDDPELLYEVVTIDGEVKHSLSILRSQLTYSQ